MKPEHLWHSPIQQQWARVLGLLLLVSLPGLYGWTEARPVPSSPGRLADTEALPAPSLTLTPLSPPERASLRERLKLDVNAAPPDRLQRLPGVGPVLARRIVDHRPYSTVKALKRVPGLGPKTLRGFQPRIRVVTDPDTRIGTTESTPAPLDLNRADTRQLQSLSGIGSVLAERIIRIRRRRGHFESIKELKQINGIGPVTVRNLHDRVRVSP